MITTNVYYRTFYVAFGNGTGTAFAIDVDGRQYLVTAAHVVDGIGNGDAIGLWNGGSWLTEPVQVVGIGAKDHIDIDVAVMALGRQIAPSYPLQPSSRGLVWGQEVYFLGFPYGLFGASALMHNGFPVPMVKRALMSGQTNDPHECFLLDGHNNPGFSGGPMVFKKPGTNEFQVGGVISGYRAEHAEVLFEGKPTKLASLENTGIIVCPNIGFATDAIAANPIGPPITE